MGCIIKTPIKNSSHTIFQAGSPWATLILHSMFVVGVLYCVQLLSEVKMFQNHSLLYFSFPLLILLLFTFLAPFFWNSQKCPISQNIGRLTKTKLKTVPKQFFKGVVHQQAWSSTVCFLWGSAFVFSCCLRWKFSSIPFTISFAKACFFYLASSSWNQNQQIFPKDELQPTKKINEWPWPSIVCLLSWSSIVSIFFDTFSIYKIIFSFPLL